MNVISVQKKIYFKWIFHPPVITRDRVFIDEALYTFICKTECVINKISLSVISDRVNDFDTLTSNHSLVVEAYSDQPPGEFSSKVIHAFLYKQHFHKQRQTEIGKKSSGC